MIGNREKKTYSGWILGMEAHQSFIRQHANVTDVLSQDGRIETDEADGSNALGRVADGISTTL